MASKLPIVYGADAEMERLQSGDYIPGITPIYIDGVLQAGKVMDHTFNLTTTGGNGIASRFLTSDGLTKSGSNTFLFTTIIRCGAGAKTIQTTAEAAGYFGRAYNPTTGLMQWKFEESKTTGVLIGANVEGLEDEEDGSTVECWVIGI